MFKGFLRQELKNLQGFFFLGFFFFLMVKIFMARDLVVLYVSFRFILGVSASNVCLGSFFSSWAVIG